MMHKVEDAQKMLMNKAEAKLNRVRSSADTGSSERKRTTEKFTRVIRRTHLRALRSRTGHHSQGADKVGKSKSTCLLRLSLCLGKMYEHPEANARWEEQLEL